MQTYDAQVKRQMVHLYGSLSEKDRRRDAAVEAAKLGPDHRAYLAGVIGCYPDTIAVGAEEIEELPADAAEGRDREKGRPGCAKRREITDWVPSA